MTDQHDAPTEKLEPPQPPPAPEAAVASPAPAPHPPRAKLTGWIERNPQKVLIAGAAIGLFGFGAICFGAGVAVGSHGGGGHHMEMRMQDGGSGPMGGRMGRGFGPGYGPRWVPAPNQQPQTSSSAPTTTPTPSA